MLSRAYESGDWDGSITAGVEAGRLAVDVASAGYAVIGVSAFASKIATAGASSAEKTLIDISRISAERNVGGFGSAAIDRVNLNDGYVLPSVAGFVRRFEQDVDQVYYRVYSGDAIVGSWLTAVPPRNRYWAQEALSLPPSNQASMIQEVLVPRGTFLERSRAIPMPEWGRWRGGAEQFRLIDEIPPSNFGPGRPLL